MVALLVQVLLTDTVGFIQKLPTQLVAAFRATLEEITEASLLLHVVDVSHPNAAAQTQAVMQVSRSPGQKPWAITLSCMLNRTLSYGQYQHHCSNTILYGTLNTYLPYGFTNAACSAMAGLSIAFKLYCVCLCMTLRQCAVWVPTSYGCHALSTC